MLDRLRWWLVRQLVARDHCAINLKVGPGATLHIPHLEKGYFYGNTIRPLDEVKP